MVEASGLGQGRRWDEGEENLVNGIIGKI